jgi:hypothetical protein
MDRNNINLPTTQIGFLNVFVKPAIEAVAHLLPKAKKNVDNLNISLKKWMELEEDWTKNDYAKLEGDD